jgi:hypothetical protein
MTTSLRGIQSFLMRTSVTILFAALLLAWVAWFVSETILIRLVELRFGDLDGHRNVYDNPIARLAGYAALSTGILIGVAVSIIEVIAIVHFAITGTLSIS